MHFLHMNPQELFFYKIGLGGNFPVPLPHVAAQINGLHHPKLWSHIKQAQASRIPSKTWCSPSHDPYIADGLYNIYIYVPHVVFAFQNCDISSIWQKFYENFRFCLLFTHVTTGDEPFLPFLTKLQSHAMHVFVIALCKSL